MAEAQVHEDGSLGCLDEEALARNAGARGLRAILEGALLDIMYDVPSRSGNIKEVVERRGHHEGEAPLIVYQKEAELARVGLRWDSSPSKPPVLSLPRAPSAPLTDAS